MRTLCLFFLVTTAFAQSTELGGVKILLNGHQGPAVIQAERLEKFKLRVDVDPKGETKPLAVRVELPNAGPNAWPATDVEVRDAGGHALLVQRTGIEWFKILVPLPVGVTTCFVQAVEPPGGWSKPTSDKDRAIQDNVSGVSLRIAKWHNGRSAALSIRFDDSHPTQLTKAVPILREHGFRGTFMINPGVSEQGSGRVSDFEQHRAEWEALAKQGDHEFANHSAHHRGGFGDEDMEAEIGEAAQAIWKLTSGKSRLTALNLGGGTRWDTTRTLRYYLVRYHHFDASENSTGMDDSYGNRVENFRRILDQHIQRGLWCRIHYHYIGDGLSSTEANFRAGLDIAKQHASDLWIAGMADIYKYQTARNAAKLTLLKSDAQHLSFQITCTTDPALYDQPLTIEVATPPTWDRQKVVVKDAQGAVITARLGKVDGADVLRFDVSPHEGSFVINE
ncbi:polysaccharide deacetylase family protein [Prosthecobacter sp.]|uniref:polysaccharide deacetylase family protein n=1 Tax=Prosthecobacter sp. TaxID=1965333 RepID=UPI002ABC318F|nr:polysaccharide deacetylase family protein [Prosthecobacter sp.]MDZ4401412.1 polysaccharide deacetylase family protein [Prosthecobacter sp.]